jgi:hypothetical protein
MKRLREEEPSVKKIARDLKREVSSAWVMGDSIKADVNPGIKVGACCIL